MPWKLSNQREKCFKFFFSENFWECLHGGWTGHIVRHEVCMLFNFFNLIYFYFILLLFPVLGMEPMASCLVGKPSPMEPWPSHGPFFTPAFCPLTAALVLASESFLLGVSPLQDMPCKTQQALKWRLAMFWGFFQNIFEALQVIVLTFSPQTFSAYLGKSKAEKTLCLFFSYETGASWRRPCFRASPLSGVTPTKAALINNLEPEMSAHKNSWRKAPPLLRSSYLWGIFCIQGKLLTPLRRLQLTGYELWLHFT